MILVLCDPQIGGTFLTWSLHYLAGHQTYFRSMDNAWLELPENPVTALNAHGYRSNHPLCIADVYSTIDHLKNTPTDQFHTVYLHNFLEQKYCRPLFHQPSFETIQRILPSFSKIIVLTNSHLMYSWACDHRGELFLTRKQIDKSHSDIVEFFWKDYENWNNLGLTNIWDHREFLALCIRPKTTRIRKIERNVDLSCDHYSLDSFELYNVFDETVNRLFDYIKIPIDPRKKTHWNSVYQQWRKLHYRRMQFAWYFDTIINYILHGYYMDLLRFELDIVQEACIQHELIYQHNLNLKTWQLSKFDNTKQLHQLLETNTHTLKKPKYSIKDKIQVNS